MRLFRRGVVRSPRSRSDPEVSRSRGELFIGRNKKCFFNLIQWFLNLFSGITSLAWRGLRCRRRDSATTWFECLFLFHLDFENKKRIELKVSNRFRKKSEESLQQFVTGAVETLLRSLSTTRELLYNPSSFIYTKYSFQMGGNSLENIKSSEYRNNLKLKRFCLIKTRPVLLFTQIRLFDELLE